MNTINTLSCFVISAFLLLLTTQAFAARPAVTAVERVGNNIRITLDQAIKPRVSPPSSGRKYNTYQAIYRY